MKNLGSQEQSIHYRGRRAPSYGGRCGYQIPPLSRQRWKTPLPSKSIVIGVVDKLRSKECKIILLLFLLPLLGCVKTNQCRGEGKIITKWETRGYSETTFIKAGNVLIPSTTYIDPCYYFRVRCEEKVIDASVYAPTYNQYQIGDIIPLKINHRQSNGELYSVEVQ